MRELFGHAAIQALAVRHDIDLLHIKGAALDEQLTWVGRTGSDADVLVRPTQVKRLVSAMVAAGWSPLDRFWSGSPFGHAMTLGHPVWGAADVHRSYPGFGPNPQAAFDRLWSGHRSRPIAGIACWVPDLPAQVLIVMLHAARSNGSVRGLADVASAWSSLDGPARAEVRALAAELDCELPLAIAAGEDLTAFRTRPDFDLWQAVALGSTRRVEWMARIKAAPSLPAKALLVLRAGLPNVGSLAVRLGRRPTRAEIAVEFVARLRRGVFERAPRP